MTFLKLYKFLGILVLALSFGSCGINSNVMFKTPKDGSFKYDSIPMRPVEDYRISVDDKLSFTLSTNNGKNLIEGISGTSVGNGSNGSNTNFGGSNIVFGNQIIEYLVMSNGFVELPLLGSLYVQGLTVKQCEDTLEVLFKSQYQDPFVQLKVTNRRCVVFSGNGSSATIVTISNNNITLLEVLAMTGGISSRGKARLIKVMRKVEEKREIYLIDVSTIEGLKYADMIIQGNDYIYIEPRPDIIKGVLAEWAPISSLIATAGTFYLLIKKF